MSTISQRFESKQNIDDTPSLDFAMLYNENKQTDSVIELETIDLHYKDFLNVFYYSNGGGFNINPNAKQFNLLQLSNLFYTSNNNKMSWNLKNQLLKTFSKKNNIPESSISPIHKIQLERETFSLNSLSLHNKFQVALALDEILYSIENTHNIVFTGDSDDNVPVILKLNYLYYSAHLDTAVSFVLPLRVKFPKYKHNCTKEERNITFEYSKNEYISPPDVPLPKPILVTTHKSEPQEFYEDDATIQTFGTKHLMSTLFDDNEQDDVLLEEETHFRNKNNW